MSVTTPKLPDVFGGRRTGAVAFASGFVAVVVGWGLASRRRRQQVAGRAHYLLGKSRGVRYRITGGHPSEDVADHVLADRVRSVLGRTTKRLDVPHVHVAVVDRTVYLDGDVGTDADADEIERVVKHIPGVAALASHLHVGLVPGDSRPSEGALGYAPSPALRRLVAAAEAAGLPEPAAKPAVRAVLATFFARLPGPQREHLAAHLPIDVQVYAAPGGRRGPRLGRARHLDEFLAAVVEADHIDAAQAQHVAGAILAELRELVPEQSAHVAAVLPPELRELWFARPERPATTSTS